MSSNIKDKKRDESLIVVVLGLVFLIIGIGIDGTLGFVMLASAILSFLTAIALILCFNNKKKKS